MNVKISVALCDHVDRFVRSPTVFVPITCSLLPSVPILCSSQVDSINEHLPSWWHISQAFLYECIYTLFRVVTTISMNEPLYMRIHYKRLSSRRDIQTPNNLAGPCASSSASSLFLPDAPVPVLLILDADTYRHESTFVSCLDIKLFRMPSKLLVGVSARSIGSSPNLIRPVFISFSPSFLQLNLKHPGVNNRLGTALPFILNHFHRHESLQQVFVDRQCSDQCA